MSNENLKNSLEALKKSLKDVKEKAEQENVNPNDLLSQEELEEILGGSAGSGGDCNGIHESCSVHL